MLKKYIIINILCFFLIGSIQAQITVDETLTTQQLIEDILINSSCAVVDNFQASTGTNFGDVNGIAAFDSNGSGFPFSAGIILSSGAVSEAPGPNLDLLSDGRLGWPGDADLEANTTATNTNNAFWIQFDFTPLVDQVSFKFLMASEEYDENFECTFSDAFAFILTDLATNTVQNLAVVPGTTTPIEVTNIRPEVIGQCPAVNEQFFEQYNFDGVANPNVNTVPAAQAVINFNGQTVPLTAEASVVAGGNYTIKLVVADETDTAFDMAVFLEASSFNIGGLDLGNDITIANGNASCTGEPVLLDGTVTVPASYQWFQDGVEITGATNPTLEVFETATYEVVVTVTSSGCDTSDSVFVEFFPGPQFDLGDSVSGCNQDEVVLDATPSNAADLTVITYQWFRNGVELVGETNAQLTVNESGTYRAEVTGDGCLISDEVEIVFIVYTVNLGGDQNLCDVPVYTITANLNGANASDATFLWNTGATTQSIDVTQSGTYTVTTNVMDCEVTETVTINLEENPAIELGDDFETCFVDPVVLDASPSNFDPTLPAYQWFLNGNVLADETNPTLGITETGTYTVIVTVGFCSSEDIIVVSPRADLEVSLGEDFRSCPNDTQVLTAITSETDVTFEWYLNGDLIEGQETNTIEVTIPDNSVGSLEYSVIIRLGECSGEAVVSILPYAIDNCVISEGISPNNDGLNDCLDLEFLADRSGPLTLKVFNRYGMQVYEQSSYINEFCGVDSNGRELETGTYFYVLEITEEDSMYGNLKTGYIYINKEQ